MDIQFRAWDKCKKIMITDIRRMNFDNESLYGIMTWEDEILYSNDFELMQFTGLKDKNGKKIFEGDGVLFWHEEQFFKGFVKGDIEWDDSKAQFVIMFPDAGVSIPIASIDLDFVEIEVIGNIYGG